MSGLEIGGLVVGIIPIVVEVFKSYSAARKRLKAFIRFHDVINDVHFRFRVAAGTFANTWQLLLQSVVDDPGGYTVCEMTKDPKHAAWLEPSLEKRLGELLGDDYERFQGVVLKIRDVLRTTQNTLSKFDLGYSRSHELPSVTQRLYQAFNISRKENEYRRWLDDLDEWNVKLDNLRKQRQKLRKRQLVAPSCVIRKSTPKTYSDVRAASQGLYESLNESFSCTNVSHSGHNAKLSLEAVTGSGPGNVQLDMAIACQKITSGTAQSLAPIWLQVRSITTIKTSPVPILDPSEFLEPLSASLRADVFDLMLAKTTCRPSGKRVRPDEPSKDKITKRSQVIPTVASGTPNEGQLQTFTMLDLRATESICCHLSKACSPTSTCKDGCLGYLDNTRIQNPLKLVFYDAAKVSRDAANSHVSDKESVPVRKLLQQRLAVLHQLTLAYKLAAAVLQYYSTPWLPEDWDLQQVAYFTDDSQVPEKDISRKLQSLHLGTEFPSKTAVVLPQSQQELEDLKSVYGIRNLCLAKLGVALLEICLRGDFEISSPGSISNDVFHARRLLEKGHHSLMTFGKRYLDVVRKCIYCDFGCGDHLDDGSLRDAVYTEVVCRLEDVMNDWKKYIG